MNEFEFICKICNQLSDDGDIPKKICMSCDDHIQHMEDEWDRIIFTKPAD